MCTPLDVRRAPATLVDAKMSLPFIVGIAASKGKMGIADFTRSGLKDPDVLAMAAKVCQYRTRTRTGRSSCLTVESRL